MAGIIRSYPSICFLSSHGNRETNLKPREMKIDIILNHHCVQLLKTLIAWLCLKDRAAKKLFLYQQLSGHLPSQLLSLACVCVCACLHVCVDEGIY